MARRIIDAGLPVALWARRAANLEPFNGASCSVATSLAELGVNSDVIGVCVFDDEGVRKVTLGEGGVLATMAPGSILVIHSTVSVTTMQDIEAAARQRGIAVLDAPVAGSRLRAEQGTLAVMVGGDGEAYHRALPVLQCYGGTIAHMGKCGNGQLMKALNNALAAANVGLAAQALEKGSTLGLPRDEMLLILKNASGASFMLDVLTDMILPNPDFARHVLAIMRKDVALYQGVHEGNGEEPTLIDMCADAAMDMLAKGAFRPDL